MRLRTNTTKKMKTFSIITFIALLISIIISSCNDISSKSTGESKIFIKNRTINIGTIDKSYQPVVTTSFIVSNKGIAPLIIKEITPSCDCVSIQGDFPDTILKGKNKTFNLSINLEEESGEIEKKIFIRSNDPDKLKIIHIKGFINNKLL